MFQVPESKASVNQFEFKIGDTAYSVPLMKYLSVETAMDVEANGTPAILRAFGDAAEAVKGLEQEQFDALMGAWTDASGITPGESVASETS